MLGVKKEKIERCFERTNAHEAIVVLAAPSGFSKCVCVCERETGVMRQNRGRVGVARHALMHAGKLSTSSAVHLREPWEEHYRGCVLKPITK